MNISNKKNLLNNKKATFLIEGESTEDHKEEVDTLNVFTIPGTITKITEEYVNTNIKNSKHITHVVISEGVKSIEWEAFSKCISLASVVITEDVESIGMWAFSGCTGLTSAVIHKGVKWIGDYAFPNCTSLKTIILPDQFCDDDYRKRLGIDKSVQCIHTVLI